MSNKCTSKHDPIHAERFPLCISVSHFGESQNWHKDFDDGLETKRGRPTSMTKDGYHATHNHYAKKIKANTKHVQMRKTEIANKIARREDDSEADLAKAHSTVGLNPMDLDPILFGG